MVMFATLPLHAQAEESDLAAARPYYLDNLIELPDYAPGKNSFLVQKMHRRERKTLLELQGGGSVRHIWSTWSIPGDDSDVPAAGRVLMRVFVNGEKHASIEGSFDELCKAAESTATRFVPLPAFNYKGAFNFYLPIFFDHGIRIETEATGEIEEFYTQIDYRAEKHPQHSSRLISEKNGGALTLRYGGKRFSWRTAQAPSTPSTERSTTLEYGERPSGFTVRGPGIIRKFHFRGDALSDLELQICWDNENIPSVQAPLKYFFADFINAAMESSLGESTTYFPMPFRHQARILLRSISGTRGRVTVDYSLDTHTPPSQALYFHAQYRDSEKTLGYAQYPVLQTRGEGLFVGMNLFDSGHNHGGGDAALIDAGTSEPRVLHGICGEDYFGFAWHHTGTMTLLTGAPAHERRYRLHLENPYPFHESIQFSFGSFAGQRPRSVAFFYQRPHTPTDGKWSTFNIPWKLFGPVGLETSLPDSISNGEYSTVVPINQPITLRERWQDADMRAGFLDATYQFRHYAMVDHGTGFVPGASKTQLIAYIYSPSHRSGNAVLGHDDRVSVKLNNNQTGEIPARNGFGGHAINFPLDRGWNKLELTVYNNENVNWR